MNLEEKVKEEIVHGITHVENIRAAIESSDDVNMNEAKVIGLALEAMKEKFKLKVMDASLESLVGNKQRCVERCNAIITALESREEWLSIKRKL